MGGKMNEYKSRVYTDRPPYADYDAPRKFMAIEAIITGFCGGVLVSIGAFELLAMTIIRGDARAKRMRSHRRVA